MEKIQKCNNSTLTNSFIISVIFSLSLLAFVFCIVAEFKKSKIEDVKLNGKLCELGESEAYGFGIAALGCFLTAQMIGNLIVYIRGYSGVRICHPKRLTFATTLLLISWLSFGVALMLLSTSISMNRRQTYGKGWLDGDCYLVKDGIFIGAGILVLLSLACTLTPMLNTFNKELLQVNADQKAKMSVLS